MIKHLLIKLMLLIIILAGGCGTTQPPNIIYINADDLGWMDLGVYGSSYYETPNLDRLAGQGMMFTDAYSSAANCAPSRACLMTGLYGPRHGVYTVGSSERGASKDRKLIPVSNTVRLDTAFTTMADELKRTGYVTASIGKWHLGKDPLIHGFDVNIAGGNGGPRSYIAPYIKPVLDAPEGEYLTDRITREAIDFIEENRDNTFFLYLPYFAVHSPLKGKEELVEKYRNKEGSPGQHNAVYAAMIDALDQNIGILLNKLDELELAGRTIVIFTSDNGGIKYISSQEPLRAGKGSYYEGGIREPLIIRWPGKIRAGSRCSVPVISVDFYPTMLELAGIKDPINNSLDGTSIVPLVLEQGEFDEDRTIFWHFPIYLDGKYDDARDSLFRTRPGSAVRYGEWKLHEYFEDGGLELYKLTDDHGERNNLAEKMPEKTIEMHRMLIRWREQVSAPMPVELNPAYVPDTYKEN